MNEELDIHDEEEDSSTVIQPETLEHTGLDVLAERRQRLAVYRRKFEAALTLYEREIDNDNFVRNYDAR